MVSSLWLLHKYPKGAQLLVHLINIRLVEAQDILDFSTGVINKSIPVQYQMLSIYGHLQFHVCIQN